MVLAGLHLFILGIGSNATGVGSAQAFRPRSQAARVASAAQAWTAPVIRWRMTTWCLPITHFGWINRLRHCGKYKLLLRGKSQLIMSELPRHGLMPAQAQVNSRRRSLVSRILMLPLVPLASNGWWLPASSAVVIRDGWVLSKAD